MAETMQVGREGGREGGREKERDRVLFKLKHLNFVLQLYGRLVG